MNNRREFIAIVAILAVLLLSNLATAGKFRNGHFTHPPKGSKELSQAAGNGKANPEGSGKGKVTGIISGEDGQSMEGCKVCFFDQTQGPAPADESLWWRIPDEEYSGLVDAEGNFTAEVPAGDYVVASVGRLTPDQDFGPPAEGELVFISDTVNLGTGKNINIGKGTSRIHTNKKLKGTPEGLTRIEGTILDEQGNPFKGGFVIAYPHGYLSKRTKADGKFTLYLPQGGEYSLAARNVYGFT